MLASPLAILYTTVALDLIGFGMVVPLMPLYAQQFAVGPWAISWLMASYSLMQFFFAPLWGQLSDRRGRRPVLLLSMAGNTLALVGFALSQSYTQLLISRIVAGICTANIAVASAYVADSTSAKTRARGMGGIGAAFGLGFVLGPALAGELSVYGTRVPPYVAAALAAINLGMAYWRLPESLPPRPVAAPQVAPWWQQRIAAARVAPGVWPLVALVFTQIFAFAMMELALTLMVHRRFGLDAAGNGRLLALMGLVLVLVQGVLVGRLSGRLSNAAMATCGLACMAVGLAGVAVGAPYGLNAVRLALGLVALGQGLTSPALSAWVSAAAPAHAQGATLGLSQSGSALARVLGPTAAGLLYQDTGELAPFACASAVLVAAAATSLFIARRPPQSARGVAAQSAIEVDSEPRAPREPRRADAC